MRVHPINVHLHESNDWSGGEGPQGGEVGLGWGSPNVQSDGAPKCCNANREAASLKLCRYL